MSKMNAGEAVSNPKKITGWFRRSLLVYLSRGDSSQVPQLFPLVSTPEAFVSIQLEKQGLRERVLNTFTQKKEALGCKTP